MVRQERDAEAGQATRERQSEKTEKSAAHAEGVYDTEIRVGLALEELDKVITPLEDRALIEERTRPFTGYRLLGVARSLRLKPAIAALTAVSAGRSEREEIVTLSWSGLAHELMVIVDPTRMASHSITGDGYKKDVYPTKANNLYMEIIHVEPESKTVTLFTARPEVFKPKQPTVFPTA